MIPKQSTELPCAGHGPGQGCGVFERYAENEILFLNQYQEEQDDELGDNTDITERVALLDDPEALRKRLYRDFIAAGFCMLAYVRAQKSDAETAVSLPQDGQLAYAGCEPAIAELQD